MCIKTQLEFEVCFFSRGQKITEPTENLRKKNQKQTFDPPGPVFVCSICVQYALYLHEATIEQLTCTFILIMFVLSVE